MLRWNWKRDLESVPREEQSGRAGAFYRNGGQALSEASCQAGACLFRRIGLLVNKQGTLTGGNIGAQSLTRHRKQQVRWQTATGNRIHQRVGQLLPGFLDERNSADNSGAWDI